MRSCPRCRNIHIGSLTANRGWMVLFLCDWEESCQEWELEAQALEQMPITGWRLSDPKRFIELVH